MGANADVSEANPLKQPSRCDVVLRDKGFDGVERFQRKRPLAEEPDRHGAYPFTARRSYEPIPEVCYALAAIHQGRAANRLAVSSNAQRDTFAGLLAAPLAFDKREPF